MSLAEAKTWLRVDANDEDDLISAMITAGRALVESVIRRALVTQTWRIVRDVWRAGDGGEDSDLSLLAIAPAAQRIIVRIPLAPVQTVNAVRVYDAAGQPQIVPPSLYQTFGAPDKAQLVFMNAPPQPGRAYAGIEIDVITGYGFAADVPAPLKQAILALLALWYENRGDGPTIGPDRLPKRISALLAPYRCARLQ